MGVINIDSPLDDLVAWYTSHPGQRAPFWINDTGFETWYDYRGAKLCLLVNSESYSWPIKPYWSQTIDDMSSFAQNYADEIEEKKGLTVEHGVTLMELFEAES